MNCLLSGFHSRKKKERELSHDAWMVSVSDDECSSCATAAIVSDLSLAFSHFFPHFLFAAYFRVMGRNCGKVSFPLPLNL